MSRFLTTIPNNTGFVNLGLVETYPTGGGGPTAYGPTSYYGSDPRPAEDGDNLNNPIDLGDFSSIFKSFEIKNTHGGLTRKQTTFYKIKLTKPTCESFCCNPKHITIKELKDYEEPKKITSIKLSHDNIFEYYKNRQKPSCQKCPDS